MCVSVSSQHKSEAEVGPRLFFEFKFPGQSLFQIQKSVFEGHTLASPTAPE